jgi:hypothetical protein
MVCEAKVVIAAEAHDIPTVYFEADGLRPVNDTPAAI